METVLKTPLFNNPFTVATILVIILIILSIIFFAPDVYFKTYVRYFIYSWFSTVGLIYLHSKSLEMKFQQGFNEKVNIGILTKEGNEEIKPTFEEEEKKPISPMEEDEFI